MITMEQKFNALAACVLAEDTASLENAKKTLQTIMRNSTKPVLEATPQEEEIVHEYLAEIGANPALNGYKYVVYGILEAAKDPDVTDTMTFGFYPMVAVKFNTTASRAERAIRHVIELIWETGDYEKLDKLFGCSVSASKGKPTNGHFIARSAIIVRSRMKQ